MVTAKQYVFLVMVAGFSVAALAQEQPARKHSVPDAAELDAVKSQADQIVQKKLAGTDKDIKGLSRQDLKKVAIGLIRREAEKAHELPLRYALLTRAVSLGLESAMPIQALSPLRDLEKDFEFDSLSMRIELIRALGKKAKEDQLSSINLLIHDTVFKAIDEDRYDLASEVSGIASTDFKRFSAPRFKREIQDLADRLKECQDAYDAISTAIESLKQNKRNAQSALDVGRYICFIKHDWGTGLPLLAKGSDSALAEVAADDLESPVEANRCVEIATAWKEYSQTVDAAAREQTQRRALYWYRKARPGLSEAARPGIERQIEDLAKSIPSGPIPYGARVLLSFEKPTWKSAGAQQSVLDLSDMKNHAETKRGKMVNGKAGKAISFDAGDHAEFKGNVGLGFPGVSVACWINVSQWRSSETNDVYIAGSLDHAKFGGFQLAANRQSVGFIIGSDGQFMKCRSTYPATFDVGTWYHLVGTYDERRLRIYVDGRLDQETAFVGEIAPAAVFRIGRPQSQEGWGFAGIVDELAVFPRALLEEEVDTLYRMGVAGKSFLD